MTEHPNAVAFRQAIAEMMQGNVDRFRDLLAAGVVWQEADNPQPSGRRRGHGHLRGYPVAEIAYFHEGKLTERWAFMDAVPAAVAAFFSA